jgi:hypothetical protein
MNDLKLLVFYLYNSFLISSHQQILIKNIL